jgi:hypothetical protein
LQVDLGDFHPCLLKASPEVACWSQARDPKKLTIGDSLASSGACNDIALSIRPAKSPNLTQKALCGIKGNDKDKALRPSLKWMRTRGLYFWGFAPLKNKNGEGGEK